MVGLDSQFVQVRVVMVAGEVKTSDTNNGSGSYGDDTDSDNG